MFTHTGPQSPTLVTSPSQALPTAPSRSSRLRGLSYLRRNTQTHLSSHSQQSSVSSTDPAPRPDNISRSISSPIHIVPTNEDPAPSQSVTEGTLAGGASFGNKRRDNPTGRQASLTSSPQAVTAEVVAFQAARTVPRTMRPRNVSQSVQNNAEPVAPSNTTKLAGYPQDQMPTIRFLPVVEHHSSRPSLLFKTTSRTLPHEQCVIRVGRYSERDANQDPPPNVPSAAPVGFKSKVVSRKHCEFWCSGGQWYIKDVKSSSGTFLNHIRLSQPSAESKPFPVNDGDLVQLGIDFRGGEEMIFRCVKIRIECNRAWQKAPNNFNTTTHKRLLGSSMLKNESDTASTHSSECSICLISIAPCQSLFVAPCSHVWHYKCIKRILEDPNTWPQFLCPNCRAISDLEAEVEDPNAMIEWEDDGNDDEFNFKKPETTGPKGTETNGHGPNTTTDDQDTLLATIANRSLTVANPTDSAQFIEEQDLPVVQDSACMVPGSPSPICEVVSVDEVTQPVNESLNGHHDQNGSIRTLLPLQRASTPITSDQLTSEGPMTPTNDAGPFVFDGGESGRAIL